MTFASPNGIERHRMYIRSLEEKLRKISQEVTETNLQSSETWHDNAPMDMLKNAGSNISMQIRDARELLHGIQIVPYAKPTEIGSIVSYGTIADITLDGVKESYALVGLGDIEPEKNRISYLSPLARTIISKRVGDKYVAKIGTSSRKIEIVGVRPILDADLL